MKNQEADTEGKGTLFPMMKGPVAKGSKDLQVKRGAYRDTRLTGPLPGAAAVQRATAYENDAYRSPTMSIPRPPRWEGSDAPALATTRNGGAFVNGVPKSPAR